VIGPGSVNVHALLEHFERVGLALTPRFLGLTDDGTREILSFVDGETGYPPLSVALRTEEALVSIAQAVRAIHDASQGLRAPDLDAWSGYEVAVPARIDCIGHPDLAPWKEAEALRAIERISGLRAISATPLPGGMIADVRHVTLADGRVVVSKM